MFSKQSIHRGLLLSRFEAVGRKNSVFIRWENGAEGFMEPGSAYQNRGDASMHMQGKVYMEELLENKGKYEKMADERACAGEVYRGHGE